jgi:hypothetical protein
MAAVPATARAPLRRKNLRLVCMVHLPLLLVALIVRPQQLDGECRAPSNRELVIHLQITYRR